jgi:hypothetical protein
MTFYSANGRGAGRARVCSSVKETDNSNRARGIILCVCLVGLVAFASIVIAQNAPQITSVDPSSGKVNDTVVVSGSNLGKSSVVSVYLSDDKNDYKTTIVDQTDDKITVKVPQVKAGDYNVSLETGGKLFIKPIKFKVQE